MATDNNFVVKNGLEVGGALIVNSSGQLVVATVSSNITFQDNVKAQFGASSDLQIYHDGTHSYIHDNGTGNLKVRTNSFNLMNAANSEVMINANENGAVTLYNNNSAKLATKSDGVDVTGELQSDSLDVDGNADISGKVVISNGTTAAQSTDYLYIGGNGLASSDAAIYLGNNGAGSGYGWRFFYEGSGSGNLNKLIIKSENLGSPVDALSFTQDGNATFAGTISSDAITSSGNIAINAGNKIQLSGSGDSTHHIYHNSSTDYDTVNYSTGFKLEHYQNGTQFTMDGATGNTIFSGTISSGAIESTGTINVDTADSTLPNTYFSAERFNDANGKLIFGVGELSPTGGTSGETFIGNHNRRVHIGAVFDGVNHEPTASVMHFMIDEDGDLYVSQNNTHTQWFQASTRNLSNIGTINSGAITSTGEIEATALDINGNGDISGNLTLGGYLAGPATFTIDPAAVGDNTGTVVIAGNLQVDGTTTTINSTTLTVDDLNITLASGSTNSGAANGAGLTVDCGSDTDTTFTYNGTSAQWETNTELVIQPRHTSGTPPSLTLGDLNNQFQSGISSSGHLTMRANGSGNLYWQNSSTYLMMLSSGGNLSIGNGSTGGSEILNVTGNIAVSGTVDGRDIATDGSKLDGIESGATADQTQSEINALGITAIGLSGTPNITVGTVSGTTANFTTSLDASLTVQSTDSTTGIVFTDPNGTGHIYYIGSQDRFYTDGKFGVNGSTIASGMEFQVNGDSKATGDFTIEGSTTKALTVGNGSARRELKINSSQWPEVTFYNASTENVRIGSAQTSSTYNTTEGDFYVYAPSTNTMNLVVPEDGGSFKRDNGAYTVWDSGNDGSGSGLDADTLDGQHASAFLTGNQTITLSGDVSGSGTTSIAVTIADDSHNHVISNVDGLQTALDGKLSTTGTAANSQLLDSLDSTAFLRSNADDTMSEKLTFTQTGAANYMQNPGGVTFASVSSGDNSLVLRNLGQFRFEDENNWDWNKWGAIKYDSSANIMYIGGPAASQFTSNASPPSIDVNFVGLNSSGLKKDGNVVWHAGNDGGGSGLDADLLDGQHGSHYLNYNNFTNTPTIPTNNNQLTNGAGYITGNQTITLSGDVSGSGTTSINVTIADDSHNHVISNIDGLQTALDAKEPSNDTILHRGSDISTADWNTFIDGTEASWNTVLNHSGSNRPSGSYTYGTALSFSKSAQAGVQLYIPETASNGGSTGGIWYRSKWNTNYRPWVTLWDSANDGSGSGLDADLLDGQHGSHYLDYNNFTNTPTIPSLSGYATETYVNTQVSNLVDSAPSTLDTLNELAAALGDDANFSTTVTNSIATKLPLAGGTMTGDITLGSSTSIKLPNSSSDGIRTSSNNRVIDSVDSTLRIGDTGLHTIVRLHGQGSDDFRVFYNATDYQIFHAGNPTQITQVGTITSGTWNGGVIASAYLDSDTAHLSGTQTFSGAKTFSAGINLNNSNISGVNAIQMADPGPNEGVTWSNIKIYESPDDLTTNTAGNFQVVYGSTRRFTVNSTGVDVNGALTATTKSFDIEHPTKEGMRLHHGVLEGPEHAVYIRGKSNSYIIELPEYWEGLVHEDTITVQLTPIGGQNDMWVENIEDNKVYINCEREMKQYFYFIQAERKDVERFEVEYGNSV